MKVNLVGVAIQYCLMGSALLHAEHEVMALRIYDKPRLIGAGLDRYHYPVLGRVNGLLSFVGHDCCLHLLLDLYTVFDAKLK